MGYKFLYSLLPVKLYEQAIVLWNVYEIVREVKGVGGKSELRCKACIEHESSNSPTRPISNFILVRLDAEHAE